MPDLQPPPISEPVEDPPLPPFAVEEDSGPAVHVWRPVPGALPYALSVSGVLVTALLTAGLGLARFAIHAGEALGPFGTAGVGLAAVALLAYAFLWLHEVVADSRDGHHRMPGYPDPTDLEAILGSASTGLAAAFFAGLPLGLALAVGLDAAPLRLVLGMAALVYLPPAFVGLVAGDRAFGALPNAVYRRLAEHPIRVAAVVFFALAAAPAVVTRVVDAPVPVDVIADALASFALLVTVRRLSI